MLSDKVKLELCVSSLLRGFGSADVVRWGAGYSVQMR